MKKTSFTLIPFLAVTMAFAQPATNFNCNDCGGNPHDLFTELDAGKVVVLCWVMPCGACVGPALTTYNVVQSYDPSKVYMYLCDDYANTSCSSVNSWASSNSMTNTTRFSNNAIKMSDYGSSGMPKIVVIGGTSHTVFYNANNSVNSTALQAAIDAAIDSTTTGVTYDFRTFSTVKLNPNPAGDHSILTFTLGKASWVTVEIYNQLGQKVTDSSPALFARGENRTSIGTDVLGDGLYFVKVDNGETSKLVKLIISH